MTSNRDRARARIRISRKIHEAFDVLPREIGTNRIRAARQRRLDTWKRRTGRLPYYGGRKQPDPMYLLVDKVGGAIVEFAIKFSAWFEENVVSDGREFSWKGEEHGEPDRRPA